MPTLRSLDGRRHAGAVGWPVDARFALALMRLATLLLVMTAPVLIGSGSAAAAGKDQAKSNDGEKDNGDKDKGDKDNGDKKEETPVERDESPPRQPDPRELEAKPDASGRVRFGFYGQPWPGVLQWLANVSGKSLDWQELPPGYLNLSTQRSYALPEARNLLNGRLQARGYTLLENGEVLSVVKIDQLDPSQVPRVSEDELYDRQPNDIVKLTFALPDGIEPKQAVEDVKQALSKHAKALPLAATRRLLVIDSVANLRLVSAVLNEERIEQEGREMPARFVLRHARAEKVINTLYVVLGLDPAAQPSQMELQIQQQKMQLLMQMQGAGKDVTKLLNKDGPPVYLAFNRHENSILANAPPKELKIIERAIAFLDVPAQGSTVESAGPAIPRFPKTYQLETIDPRTLVGTLEEIGDLDPLTELRADNKAKILFVRGSEGDHEKVAALISQLDQSGLRYEVFWLDTRVPADAVAESIVALLGEEEEDGDDDMPWYYRRNGGSDRKKQEVDLRVAADIESNRLLVRGSEEQIEQVNELLVKMEAVAESPSVDRPLVQTEPLGAEQTERLLEQLKRLWPTAGDGSELRIDDSAAPRTETEAPRGLADPSAAEPRATRFRFAAGEGASTTEPQAKRPSAAVSVTVTPDGRLLIAGSNPQSVARLRGLVESLTPPADLFQEFPVRHASAYYIHWKLEDYFEEELNQNQGELVRDWWGSYRKEPKNKSRGLSRRRPLRLIYNKQTNSIVAANASAQQLQTIGRLIETWDKPPRPDLIAARKTGMVKVRYSRAKTIAAAVKEVYRDLLSSRDKEFDTEDEKGTGFTLPRTTEIEFGQPLASSGVSKTKPIDVAFDGALSVGVDEIANMLVISAERDLYDSVEAMINRLDDEARPQTTLRVMRVGVSARAIQDALSDSVGNAWSGGRPEATPGRPQEGGDVSDRRRRRDGRRRRER